MEKNLKTIELSSSRRNLFDTFVKPVWTPWLGFAFERFCIKHGEYLAELMGFSEKVLNFAPYYKKGDGAFQVDLLYQRSDRVIVLCEIKYENAPISTKVIPEIQRKCELIQVPRGYTLERALISVHGADKSLRDSDFFHHIVGLDQILP